MNYSVLCRFVRRSVSGCKNMMVVTDDTLEKEPGSSHTSWFVAPGLYFASAASCVRCGPVTAVVGLPSVVEDGWSCMRVIQLLWWPWFATRSAGLLGSGPGKCRKRLLVTVQKVPQWNQEDSLLTITLERACQCLFCWYCLSWLVCHLSFLTHLFYLLNFNEEF